MATIPDTAGASLEGIAIYFGSQTGTAESFAFDFSEDCTSRGFAVDVIDLESFSKRPSKTRLHVYLMATTGEGDPTDNAAQFHGWASDPNLSKDSFAGVPFAVFGLGDRNYADFNRMGEVTDGNLERMGGSRICVRGSGDDAGDIVEDFRQWRDETFWPAAEALKPIGRDTSTSTTSTTTITNPAAGRLPGYLEAPGVLQMAQTVAELPQEVPGKPADVVARFYFEAERARVTSVRELRQEPDVNEGETTVHVALDVSSCPNLVNYSVGGNIEVLPENDPADVAAILPLLGISEAAKPGDVGDLDCCITFTLPRDGSSDDFRKPFPTPCPLREALIRYCDLRSAPTKRMLQVMRAFLETPVRERIDRLLADDAALKIVQDDALAWTQLEFWECIGAKRLDLNAFLCHCPRQRPRPYTVASSPLATPGEVHLCVSLNSSLAHRLDTAVAALCMREVFPPGCSAPIRPERTFGVCSKWLCTQLAKNSSVLARVRPSAFQLVQDDVPLVMIAAGAGVAPFRGFWQELKAMRGKRRAPAALFFGCRHADRDWIYRSEMATCTSVSSSAPPTGGYAATTKDASQSQPTLAGGVFVAFSRKGEEGVYDPSGCCGEYVQDQVRARGCELLEWTSAGGVVYVCGSNAMGRGVWSTLVEILGGEEELKRLRESGQIRQELWGEAPRLSDMAESALKTLPGADGFQSAVHGGSAEPGVEGFSIQLAEAVKNGNHCQVQELIAKGADVNLQALNRKYTRIGLRQEVGETPLHWAALRGDELVAEWLIAAQADPNLRDQDGKAPLHIAAFNSVASVSEQLLKARADPDARDLRGNTPMQWVVLAGGSMRMLRLLLKYNARGDIASDDGDLPADVAAERGSDAAADLIREACAR